MNTNAMNTYDIDAAKRHFAAKLAYTTGSHELAHMIDSQADVVIVDVRLPKDYRAGHIPGAINLPNGRWQKPEGLRKDTRNILYCYSQTCHLAAEAAAELLALGYPVVEMEGGFAAWQADGAQSETDAASKAAA